MDGNAKLPIGPGDVIDGKYVVEQLLGQGGMGAVFAAREEQLGRRVAIKIVLPLAAHNEEVSARFEREARTAAALHGEHVTRVFGAGRLPGGLPYMAMELLEGEDLARVLSRCGPLPVHEVIDSMLQVCDALGEAHALGIVHRDLKPENIFRARRPNGSLTVKVLDFGISKAATTGTRTALTATTALIGTPAYMSPEQLREAKDVDGRADIWCLGVTMFELLTGRTPFTSEALAELCALVLYSAPAPLDSLRPDVPPALVEIVSRCLRKEPSERFVNVTQLALALEAVGGSQAVPVPVAAPGPSVPPPFAAPSEGAPTATLRASRDVARQTISPGSGVILDSGPPSTPWLAPRPWLAPLVWGIGALIVGAGATLALRTPSTGASAHPAAGYGLVLETNAGDAGGVTMATEAVTNHGEATPAGTAIAIADAGVSAARPRANAPRVKQPQRPSSGAETPPFLVAPSAPAPRPIPTSTVTLRPAPAGTATLSIPDDRR